MLHAIEGFLPYLSSTSLTVNLLAHSSRHRNPENCGGPSYLPYHCPIPPNGPTFYPGLAIAKTKLQIAFGATALDGRLLEDFNTVRRALSLLVRGTFALGLSIFS